MYKKVELNEMLDEEIIHYLLNIDNINNYKIKYDLNKSLSIMTYDPDYDQICDYDADIAKSNGFTFFY